MGWATEPAALALCVILLALYLSILHYLVKCTIERAPRMRPKRRPTCAVFHGRADALDPGGFDVAASRATFPPGEWLSVGQSLVRAGGLVLVFAGDAWSPEHSSLRAVNDLRYETASGKGLWIGAFCST